MKLNYMLFGRSDKDGGWWSPVASGRCNRQSPRRSAVAGGWLAVTGVVGGAGYF